MNILKFVKAKCNLKLSNILLLLLLSLSASLLGIVTNYLVGKFIDILTYDITLKNIYFYVFLIGMISIISIIVNISYKYKMTSVSSDMVFSINNNMLMHVKRLPLSFFESRDSVYLNQRINSDCNKLINFFITLVIKFTVQMISLIGILAILFLDNFNITILAVSTLPIYIFLYILFRQKLLKANLEYLEEQNVFFANLNRQLTNLKYIKTNSLYQKIEEELATYYPIFKEKLLYVTKCSSLFSLVGSVIENFFNVILYLYGGIQILNKNITIGEFIIIKSYYLMLIQITSSMMELLKLYPEADASLNRLEELCDITEESNGTLHLQEVKEIALDDINFKIKNKEIISNFTHTFNRGNIYGIKGRNGAGKSTLIELILGLHENYKGKISYNDKDITDVDIYSLRKNNLSVVDQEPNLLYSTLSEELSSINNMDTNKLDTLINDFDLNELYSSNKNITNISGGEKQKISIIKSFLKNPEVLILDEPTSALDRNSVDTLKKYLLYQKESSIIIMITHDKRLDDIFDNTIYLKRR